MISLSELPEEENKLANDENVTDLDWLKLRRRRMKDNEPAEDPQAREAVSKDEIIPAEVERLPERYLEEPQQSPEEITIAKISETGRLFVRNILYTSTEQEFRELFETYGPLEEVHVAIDTVPVNPKDLFIFNSLRVKMLYRHIMLWINKFFKVVYCIFYLLRRRRIIG